MPRAAAKAVGIPKAYGSVDALLADKEVEVVHNCTPNHVHHAISKKIMAAGKHVISEKPLAMVVSLPRRYPPGPDQGPAARRQHAPSLHLVYSWT